MLTSDATYAIKPVRAVLYFQSVDLPGPKKSRFNKLLTSRVWKAQRRRVARALAKRARRAARRARRAP
jgi:hypothetical protein